MNLLPFLKAKHRLRVSNSESIVLFTIRDTPGGLGYQDGMRATELVRETYVKAHRLLKHRGEIEKNSKGRWQLSSKGWKITSEMTNSDAGSNNGSTKVIR